MKFRYYSYYCLSCTEQEGFYIPIGQVQIIFKTVHYIFNKNADYRRGVFVFNGQSNIVKIVPDNSFIVQGNKNVDERGSTHCN